jgi:hypothetical protein
MRALSGLANGTFMVSRIELNPGIETLSKLIIRLSSGSSVSDVPKILN